MSATSLKQIANFGTSIVERFIHEHGAVQTDQFPELQDIKNLAGDSTGYVRLFKADKLVKLTHLSVTVAPGMRYFNIHAVPEARYNLPRYALEGMVTVRGSQVSMDMYPDMDIFMHIQSYLEQMRGVQEAYTAARETDIDFRPSRLAHMRAFCSPFFLNVSNAPGEQLPRLDEIANRYLDQWQMLCANAAELDAATAAKRQQRRDHMSDMVIALDPDRQMIVQVYGEEITRAIEQAVMYA